MLGRVALRLVIFAATLAFARGEDYDPNRMYSVQMLYQACTAPKGSQSFGRCFGYIEGAGDFMIGDTMCPKNGLNYFAMIQAFVNWAERHPEAWDEPQIHG